MFANKDFFPTPAGLINKMTEGMDFKKIHSILEPSAGDGAIVEELGKLEYGYGYKYGFDIDCVEIEPELRSILKGKGFRVVHDNFLTYDTYKEYDLIIANFPFSDGCRHLLKAMEMQRRNGGAIICLLNADTIKNPYSNDRITLKRYLEECDAKIEYIQGTFTHTERRTDVEVALIKVQMPAVERQSFILENLNKAERYQEDYEDTECAQLVEQDFF